MTNVGSRDLALGWVGRRLFDLDFLVALAAMGLFIATVHLEWERSVCGDWISNIGHALYWRILIVVLHGFMAPLMMLVCILALGARKSALTFRVCGVWCLAFGMLIVAYPPALPQPGLDELACYVDGEALPLAKWLGGSWAGAGLFLLSVGRLPWESRTRAWLWLARTAGLGIWLLFASLMLALTDTYTHVQRLGVPEWEGAVLRWLGRAVPPLQNVSVDLSLFAGAMILTLLGLRRGWISLWGLRIAVLCIACAQTTVILLNVVRLIAGQVTFADWVDADPGAPALAVAIIWTGFWFLLGYALLKIRREWWERNEGAAPYSAEMSHRRF